MITAHLLKQGESWFSDVHMKPKMHNGVAEKLSYYCMVLVYNLQGMKSHFISMSTHNTTRKCDNIYLSKAYAVKVKL